MEKYESEVKNINKPISVVYAIFSDLNNLAPMFENPEVKKSIETFSVSENSLTLSAKGQSATLNIIEKEENNYVKLAATEGLPFECLLWIQFKNNGDNSTYIKLTLHAKLNMMYKMMLGAKLKSGINSFADKLAESLNK